MAGSCYSHEIRIRSLPLIFKFEIIISLMMGAPSKAMMDFLKTIANWNITRTDKGTTNNPYDLFYDLLEYMDKKHEEELINLFVKDILN